VGPFPLWASQSLWHDMFWLGLPLAEKVIRPVLVYVALVVGLRVFGKRELAQLNPFDLVVLLSLANTVQNAMIGDDVSVTGGVIGAYSLLTVNYLVVRFLFRHRRLDQLVEGRAVVLVKDGRVVPRALAREMLTVPELMTVLRRQGFTRITEVASCTIEPGGTFIVEGVEPRPSETTRKELLGRLDELSHQIAALSERLGGKLD